jgi:hypothetical protein
VVKLGLEARDTKTLFPEGRVDVDESVWLGGEYSTLGWLPPPPAGAKMAFSVTLCAQQLPNMKVSTHIPTWRPSVLIHSQTNIHVPSTPFTEHGFGLIL